MLTATRTAKHSLILGFAAACAAVFVAGAAFAGEKAIVWKPSEQALLRIDDSPVKDWSVYQDGKKEDPLLLQIGNRFLLIEVRSQRIFEIAPAKIEHRGDDLSWDPADRPEKPLPTSAWTYRDVGLAYKIGVRLDAEGRVLNLQFPHPIDIRSIH